MPRIALIVIATTALMTWLVQPRLVHLLERWLYGRAVRISQRLGVTGFVAG